MGLKYVLEIRHPQGEPDITRPRVDCDTCGREITEAKDALVQWDAPPLDDPRYQTGGEITYQMTHKGSCDQRKDASEELYMFLAQLIGNTGLTLGDLENPDE